MEKDEVRKDFIDEIKSKNDPIEEWSTKRLKKEAEDDSGKGESLERDELGID